MRIGVIGSGVSGLVSSYLLSRSHDVTLFEADSRLGGHVNTFEVQEGSERIAIDTGFIVFNRPNYPGLNQLFEHLGVESQPSRMSFSVKDERDGIEYSGSNLGTLFASPASFTRVDHWRMLGDIKRCIRLISTASFEGSGETVQEAVRRLGLSEVFLERFLGPLGCALWSCPHETFLDYPIQFVADFLRNHQLIDLKGRPEWRTVVGGANTYVRKLSELMEAEVILDSPVDRVQRSDQLVKVESQANEWQFDEVIIACHADQALRMLSNPTDVELDLLSAFPYQKNEAILHTDISVLPKNRAAWASWNYRVPRASKGVATVTYNMNILQSICSEQTYCVSLNEVGEINPEKIIARFDYEHPVSTMDGLRAKGMRDRLIRHEGISYCGAYWGYGFHEDGVRSAREVASAFGEEL